MYNIHISRFSTFNCNLLQLLRSLTQQRFGLLTATGLTYHDCKCALNAFTVQASTTELGRLFQVLTTRAQKKYFLKS